VIVENSRKELEDAQLVLNNRLATFLEAGLVQTALDPEINAVVVRVPASIATGEFEDIRAEVKYVNLGVKVELAEYPDSLFRSSPVGCVVQYRQCNLPVRGGEEIFGMPGTDPWAEPIQACTAGFRANGTDG
jgi:hypothetical protein